MNAGIGRIIKAGSYSIKGCQSAWRHEAAFKQELIVLILAVILVSVIDFSILERICLLGALVVILIVELLNSAIEAIVDRVGTEHHELSGRAKDYGSAAVFLTISLAFVIWVFVFIDHFYLSIN